MIINDSIVIYIVTALKKLYHDIVLSTLYCPSIVSNRLFFEILTF